LFRSGTVVAILLPGTHPTETVSKESNTMMLFYAQDRNDVFEPLKQSLNGRASEACLESYSKLEDLFQRLHQSRVNLDIGVFSIGSIAELDLLLTIKDLLSDMRLVLVLADNDPQTLSKAHALAPRFISFVDAGIEPLVSVVEKMLGYRTARNVSLQAAISATSP
jgi:DNA-binding NarL/FixJ family response regulator